MDVLSYLSDNELFHDQVILYPKVWVPVPTPTKFLVDNIVGSVIAMLSISTSIR